MSLFSWLSREKQTKAPAETGAGQAEPNRGAAATPPGTRKSDRMARRELLYSVVRESMARAGVLSASYRFKVLSLDPAGRQFLVMVDLASSERADPDLLSDVEGVIVQRAKSRHDLVVSAVYWRRNDQVGAGAAARPGAGRQQARGAAAAKSQPAELLSEPPSMHGGPARQQPASAGGFEPIQEEELAALRAALANGLDTGAAPKPAREPVRPASAAAAPPAAAASGFQDTVLRGDDDPRSRTLSATQSGDLS